MVGGKAGGGRRRARRRPTGVIQSPSIGGSPGAFAARHLFRHKTRKEPFSTRLMVIAALQMGAAVGFLLL